MHLSLGIGPNLSSCYPRVNIHFKQHKEGIRVLEHIPDCWTGILILSRL